MTEPTSIAKKAAELIYERDRFGQTKYPAGMDRKDIKPGTWLRHKIEEHADALNYGLKLLEDLPDMLREAYRRGQQNMAHGDRTEASENAVVSELLG